MGDSVFDKLAEKWDKFITKSTHPVVKDFQRKERDFLDEVILEAPGGKIGLIEIGSGTGRLLFQYIDTEIDPIGNRRLKKGDLLKLKEKIAYIIGVDNSTSMMEKSIQNLMDRNLINRYMKDVFLIRMDAVNLAKKLPKFLNRYGLQDYPRIFFCMLCTLGNIPMPKRIKVLKAINKTMSPLDNFVVAVWNRERFENGIEMYEPFKGLIGNFTNRNIFRETAEIHTETGYYIHWFYAEELKEQLEKTGFRVEKLEAPKAGNAGGYCVLAVAKRSL